MPTVLFLAIGITALMHSIFADAFSVVTVATYGSIRQSTASLLFQSSNSLNELPTNSIDEPSTSGKKRRVVVIGAGIGGLASAARVAAAVGPGVDVLVLEKNPRHLLGGRCGSFDVHMPSSGGDGNGNGEAMQTFRHERGPSLLLLRDEYERLFLDCRGGAASATTTDSKRRTTAEDYGLQMRQCLPAYQVVFEDGDTVDLGFPDVSGADASLREAEKKSRAKLDSFEENGAAKWDGYLETCAAYLDCGLPNFIEEKLDIGSFPAFLAESLRGLGERWPLKPHSDVLDAIFDSNKMRALASFQDLYVGLEPYRDPNEIGGGILRKTAPAVFGLLAAIELHPSNKRAGVFAPVGGFRAVAEAAYELGRDCGVEYVFGASVTQITEEGVHIVQRDADNAEGEVEERREFLPADVVICNADVPFATKTLTAAGSVSDDKYKERYDWDDQFDFSSGVVAFHWSVSKSLDELNTHNVFLSAGDRSRAEGSWSVLRLDSSRSSDSPGEDGGDDRAFNFYVHRAGKTDDSAAPPGCDSIMVLVPCETLLRDESLALLEREESIRRYKEQFDETVVSDIRRLVLRRLAVLEGLENLDQCIINEVVDTPGTYADYYNVGAGVPFGLSHGLGQLSLTRPGAESKTQGNTLFVGASSRPGNGVPLVLIGARAVADKAVNKLRNLIAQ